MRKNKILVVVDMQNDFINGSLGTKEAQEIVSKVVKKINEFDIDRDYIFGTLDTHLFDYLHTQEGEKLPVEHCIYSTKGWCLNDIILKALKEKNVDIESHFYRKNSFGSIELADAIKKYNECHLNVEIELVGLCTDICIISNAMLIKTLVPDARVIVDASCCAGVTPESHKNALDAMKMCQIEVINE